MTISPFKIYAKKANVRRSTFYRHFNDKYDLLNHIVGTLIEYFRTLHLPEIDPKDPRQFFNKFMKDILLFISDNKAMVKVSFLSIFIVKFIKFYIIKFMQWLNDKLNLINKLDNFI